MTHHWVACLCGNSSLKSAIVEAGARGSPLETLSWPHPHAAPPPPPLAMVVSFGNLGTGKGRGDITSPIVYGLIPGLNKDPGNRGCKDNERQTCRH